MFTDQQKINFLRQGGVTWGHNVPDTHRSGYAHDVGVAVATNRNNEPRGELEEERILGQIHICVFGAIRILLHAKYINQSSLKKLCESVDQDALNFTPSNVIWKTGTTSMDLQNWLFDPVEKLNDAWNSGDEERKKTFVEYSLTLTDEDLKASVQTLSKLIKARGGYTPAGQLNGLNGFIVCKSMIRS